MARPDANFDVEPESFAERSKRVTNAWKKFLGKGAERKIAKAAYAQGDSLFRQAKYFEAAKQYKIAYDRGPDLPQEEECLFKCAESYFFADRYSKANDYYGILVKKYSNTDFLIRSWLGDSPSPAIGSRATTRSTTGRYAEPGRQTRPDLRHPRSCTEML